MNSRLLFVDDEPSIRATLPAVLATQGFEVTTAGTVAEGLRLISERTFDVLIADLNIGGPGDGFTLVSAMRRTQPEAVTLILTGYPDFKTALEAIRKQVDDYLTKPTDIQKLVSTIKEKLAHPRRLRDMPAKRAGEIMRECSVQIVETWAAKVRAEPQLQAVQADQAESVGSLSQILESLVAMIEGGEERTKPAAMDAAAAFGELRAKIPGYRIALLLLEVRLLHQSIAELLEENLLVLDLSTLVPDVLVLGEGLHAILEDSLEAFTREQEIEAA
jgi:DNA-binding response OmpR family regulator